MSQWSPLSLSIPAHTSCSSSIANTSRALVINLRSFSDRKGHLLKSDHVGLYQPVCTMDMKLNSWAFWTGVYWGGEGASLCLTIVGRWPPV